MPLFNLFLISRPRFWGYTAGPWAIAWASMGNLDVFHSPWFIFGLIYFLFPANLLIYGVNDMADVKTDTINPKKEQYEHKFNTKNRKALIISMIFANIWGAFFFFWNVWAGCMWLLFLFFGLFYSVKPIRAKSIPFLDGIFNILYIMPALVACFGLNLPINSLFLLASWLWVMAMHAYSAIPDISADKTANITTTATVLGLQYTLLYVFTLWTITFMLVWLAGLPKIAMFGACVYLGYVLMQKHAKTQQEVFVYYQYFPMVNMLCGFLLFWAFILNYV